MKKEAAHTHTHEFDPKKGECKNPFDMLPCHRPIKSMKLTTCGQAETMFLCTEFHQARESFFQLCSFVDEQISH